MGSREADCFMKNLPLKASNILPYLETKWLGRAYYYLPEVGSTNNVLKEMAASGKRDEPATGTIVLTDYQSRGRGRLNRRWEAPPATSLLFSILFRPPWPADRLNWLLMAASVAVVETVQRQTGLETGIKWPNDIVIQVDGVWRKTAGLLLEGDFEENGRCRTAVLGLGLNVNIPPDQLPTGSTPATSLLAAYGQKIPRVSLFVDLLQRLESLVETAEQGQAPQGLWQTYLTTIGRPVQVTNQSSGQVIQGTAVATNEWGQLVVRDENEQTHTILAGDVTLRSKPFDNSSECR